MKVPLLNPALGNASIMEELVEASRRVLSSGKYILGEEVEAFEHEYTAYLGATDVVGVSSGTDALIASLMALDIHPNDEVICPAFTFFATAGAISRVGAIPVFADVLPDCMTIDPLSVKDLISERTAAIIPVHLFGQSSDMDSLLTISRVDGIPVIEDAAQAIGTELRGQKVCSIGTTGCLSFFPSKNLGGFGDAGLVATQTKALGDKVRKARNHGSRETYYHDFVGGNFRIDALQAALLRVKLRYHPLAEAGRCKHAEYYLEKLNDSPYLLPKTIRGKHVYNQFTIRVPGGKRDELKKFLQDNGVSSAIYYPLPLHKQPCFSNLKPVELPVSEQLSNECLSLPIAAEITMEQIEYVVEILTKFLVIF